MSANPNLCTTMTLLAAGLAAGVITSAAAGSLGGPLELQDEGVFLVNGKGNGHMMMMDQNNLQIADLIIDWLGQSTAVATQPVAKTLNHCKGRSFQPWLNDQGLIDYRDDRFAIGRIG
jgi:hypothetical protein